MQHLVARSRPRVQAPTVAVAVVGVALAFFAIASRRSGLGPAALYEDDAWVALGAKTNGVGNAFRVGLSAPGFVALNAVWLRVAGFSETNAQVPAFVLGVASGPLFWFAATRMRIRFAPAFLATATLIASPLVATYSTRVKQYTLEIVLGIVVLLLATRVLDELGSRRRWIALALAMAVSVTCSTALLGIAVCASVAIAAALVGSRGLRGVWSSFEARLLASVAAFVAGWLGLVVRPRLTPALYAWWNTYMTRVTHETGARERFPILLPRVFEQLFAIDGRVGVAAFCAALAIVARRSLPRAVLFGGPLFVACALFFVGAAPLGGGRTDLWLIAPLALLLATALDDVLGWAIRWRRAARRRSWRAAAVAVAATWTVALCAASATQLARSPDPEQFKGFVASPLIRYFESNRQPGDVIVVAPRMSYVYALYTPYAVTTYAAPYRQHGFDVAIADPAVLHWGSYPDQFSRFLTLERRVAGARSVWMLTNLDPSDRIGPDFDKVLTRHGFHKAVTKRSALCEIQRWDRAPGPVQGGDVSAVAGVPSRGPGGRAPAPPQ